MYLSFEVGIYKAHQLNIVFMAFEPFSLQGF